MPGACRHVVDAQSFPLAVPTTPDIIKGAYAPEATYRYGSLSLPLPLPL